jgi:Cap4 dsDNA endonuclease
MSLLQTVLDPTQLKRIQATHRGFLYQHLFAVGTLLLAQQEAIEKLALERDEDLEVITKTKHLYIQVKTRSDKLIKSDVTDTLDRFSEVRTRHMSGKRPLTPEFCIITNAALAPSLESETVHWPDDIQVATPESKASYGNLLPPAWPDIGAAIDWCVRRAEQIPFGSLSGDTVVWKLAGKVLLACSGEGVTTFSVDDLPKLLEQIVVQLHRFPTAPAKYRPHEDEPDFPGISKVRLVTGFSGAGKTTWAAAGSTHCGEFVGYFDIGDMPSSAVAPALARELAALVLHDKQDEVRKLMFPGASGLQSLRGIHLFLERSNLALNVVMDNAHRINTGELVNIIRVMPSVRWIVLAQPWPGKTVIETTFDIKAETLNGWSLMDIADEFAAKDCHLNPVQAGKISRLTGGLPLYAQSLARICSAHFDRDVDKLIGQLEQATHGKSTGQEEILREVQRKLSPLASSTTAILAISDLPLTVRQSASLVSAALVVSDADASRAIREIEGWGIIELLRDGRVTMHDAFRLLAQEAQHTLDEQVSLRAKKQLVGILMESRNLDGVRLLCKLLPQVGQMETLVDFATGASEYFHELGMSQEFETILEDAVTSGHLSMSDRFWALDTVIFWNLQSDQTEKAKRRIPELEKLISSSDLNDRQLLALAMKKLLVAGYEKDAPVLERHFSESAALSSNPEFQRILRYNYAACLFRLEEYNRSESICFTLIIEYYDLLGLELQDVMFKNPPEILKNIRKSGSYLDDAKRLADVLELHARARERQNKDPQFNRIHALKFYGISNSRTSAVRVARDLVDEFLDRGDPVGAKQVVESMLLPLFPKGEALDLLVPIHSQYAVVLAYCGQFDDARRTMSELKRFLVASPQWQVEVANQRNLIERIADGKVSLPQTVPLSRTTNARAIPSDFRRCRSTTGKRLHRSCFATKLAPSHRVRVSGVCLFAPLVVCRTGLPANHSIHSLYFPT